jgi:hypothetical protein
MIDDIVNATAWAGIVIIFTFVGIFLWALLTPQKKE